MRRIHGPERWPDPNGSPDDRARWDALLREIDGEGPPLSTCSALDSAIDSLYATGGRSLVHFAPINSKAP